jgi:hypothetical protein
MSSLVWKHILINGKSKRIEVLNAQYDKGKLVSVEDLRPFDKKDDAGTPMVPDADDANAAKRQLYSDFFRKSFKNILILSAAGSSMDLKGPSMLTLWRDAEEKFTFDLGTKKELGFQIICDKVKFDSSRKDLEALLSQIEGYIKYAGNEEITLNKKKTTLSNVRDGIFKLIAKKCNIKKPAGAEFFPHKVFLEKLLHRKQTNPRLKIFTLNYDLLFEYAAIATNAIVIDGFSFTFPRTFSGRHFDYDIVQREGSKVQEEDNFVQRVFHLHKLHGSLNWERDSKTDSVIITDDPTDPLLIYPREAKYEDSYEQPFFEMMARFQRALRQSNDTMLICIGYSFNDKHVNSAIEEALNQNPSFRLAVIDPGFDDNKVSNSMLEIKKEALQSERILMVAETFADFASHFPEIMTYDNDILRTISLNHGR